MDVDHAVQYPTEFLNSIEPPGMPPRNLVLKIGSPFMLLRNLDVFLPRIPIISTDVLFEFKRLQFPVRLAFAMSISIKLKDNLLRLLVLIWKLVASRTDNLAWHVQKKLSLNPNRVQIF